MTSLQTQNTQVFHASSIGRLNYLALAPRTAAAHLGCAVVYSDINGLVQELGFTDLPVALRPAPLPLSPSVVALDEDGVPSYITVEDVTLDPASGWTPPTNRLTHRAFDTNNISHQELADIVATMIEDLKIVGVFEA